ncbi:hypothetical protein ABPG74_013639 [Tetrahymena malaccensis]
MEQSTNQKISPKKEIDQSYEFIYAKNQQDQKQKTNTNYHNSDVQDKNMDIENQLTKNQVIKNGNGFQEEFSKSKLQGSENFTQMQDEKNMGNTAELEQDGIQTQIDAQNLQNNSKNNKITHIQHSYEKEENQMTKNQVIKNGNGFQEEFSKSKFWGSQNFTQMQDEQNMGNTAELEQDGIQTSIDSQNIENNNKNNKIAHIQHVYEKGGWKPHSQINYPYQSPYTKGLINYNSNNFQTNSFNNQQVEQKSEKNNKSDVAEHKFQKDQPQQQYPNQSKTNQQANTQSQIDDFYLQPKIFSEYDFNQNNLLNESSKPKSDQIIHQANNIHIQPNKKSEQSYIETNQNNSDHKQSKQDQAYLQSTQQIKNIQKEDLFNQINNQNHKNKNEISNGQFQMEEESLNQKTILDYPAQPNSNKIINQTNNMIPEQQFKETNQNSVQKYLNVDLNNIEKSVEQYLVQQQLQNYNLLTNPTILENEQGQQKKQSNYQQDTNIIHNYTNNNIGIEHSNKQEQQLKETHQNFDQKQYKFDQFHKQLNQQLPLYSNLQTNFMSQESKNEQNKKYYDQFKSQNNQGNTQNNNKDANPSTLIASSTQQSKNIGKNEKNPNLSIKVENLIMWAKLKPFSIPIKQTVYDTLIKSLSKEDKEQNIHIIRCINDIDTSKINYLSEDLYKTQNYYKQDTFSYYKPPNNETHWYLNFADTHLFGFYTSALYAQDELQCTEMPLLAHVKEYLQTQKSVPNLKPRTQESNNPTPVLIMNVPRIGTIDIRPDAKYQKGLYGNNFRNLKEQDLKEKLTVFQNEDLVYTNIIAMSALGYNHGEYTRYQILFTLETAWKAFSQAVQCTKNYYPNTSCVIHTGNWGCGAFGNNYQLMAILQVLAANLAGVEILHYHTFNQHGTNQYTIGIQLYYEIISGITQNQRQVTLDEIIDKILKQKFVWGVSDGN